jgi:hypothetical protein
MLNHIPKIFNKFKQNKDSLNIIKVQEIKVRERIITIL